MNRSFLKYFLLYNIKYKYSIYFRYIVINTNSFKYIQNYYSNSDIQNGIVQFYNKIASRLMNGMLNIVVYILT